MLNNKNRLRTKETSLGPKTHIACYLQNTQNTLYLIVFQAN